MEDHLVMTNMVCLRHIGMYITKTGFLQEKRKCRTAEVRKERADGSSQDDDMRNHG